MKKRVAIYVRVSTEEQKVEGLSIDNQIDALQKYAKENEYQVVGIYNDAGISARKKYTKRPALLRLMSDCKAGKVDLIIFTRLDRWFRSVADYYQVQAILDDNKVPWRAIWEDYETETSSGVFKVNIMLSVAQAEADRTSEKIKSVLQYKREMGEYVGGNSMFAGYRREGNVLAKNEDEQEAVQAFFDEYLKTFSTSSARAKAFEHGLDISPKRAHYALKAEIYAGKYQNIKDVPRYITWEQHELIMKSFEERKTRVKNSMKQSHVFSGLCVCSECGRRLVVKKSTPHGSKTYIYYVCHQYKTHSINVSEKYLEDFLFDNLKVQYDREKLKRIEMSPQKATDSAETIKKLNARLKRIGIRFEDGDIDAEEYRSKRDSIKAEISKLKEESKPVIRDLDLPASWRDMYQDLDDNRKRALWAYSFDRLIVSPDKSIPPTILF